MSGRELVVLGTASQVPTRYRNHNGYLLRWDGHGILFDPGEGTQRQMTLAGVAASSVHRICITHFHGDHCLGLPGVLQRLSLDGVQHAVTVHHPAEGAEFLHHLRHASIHDASATVVEAPVHAAGEVAANPEPPFRLLARRLRHRCPTYGWRLEEPDGRRMLPERLAEAGVEGPAIGRLQREGTLVVDGRTVTVEEVSEHRRGQRFAFVMDTAWCDAAVELAAGCDLLVCESTFLDADASLAEDYRHLTAGQAGRLAAVAGVRTLVLTHFSQRYPDDDAFGEEAAAHFDGDIVVARDLQRIPVPPRAP